MERAIKKIVIIGPESTGKSTLSAALAKHYGSTWVPEYARKYLNKLDRDYTQADLRHIALGQLAAEDRQVALANKYLFCDTDLYVIKVWSEHKFGACSNEILQEIAQRKYDLYLLTNIDFPWQDDPLREHPEPEMRAYFYQIYLDIVQHTGLPFKVVSGNPESRLQQAVSFIASQQWG